MVGMKRWILIIILIPVIGAALAGAFLVINHIRYQREGLYGVEFVKQVELPPSREYAYLGVTCSDEVYVSFQGGEGDDYVVRYDSDLNQLSDLMPLTENLEGRRGRGETFTDHSLIYHDGYFYGVYEGWWPCNRWQFYLVKYDENFTILKERILLTLGPEEPTHERFDSPLIQMYGNRIYVMNSHYRDELDINYDRLPDGSCERMVPPHDRDGLVVRVFDLDLNPVGSFILKWGSFHRPIGTGDLVLFDGGDSKYGVIHMDGVISKLTMFRFDEDKNFIDSKILVPNSFWMEGHPRTIYSDGRYYIPFWGKSLLEVFNKRASKDSYIGVFDDGFGLVKLLRLTSFSEEDREQAVITPSQYACKMGDYIYTAINFATPHKRGEGGGWVEKAVLVKYKLSDSSGGGGPQVPSLEDSSEGVGDEQSPRSMKKCGDGVCDGPETPESCPQDCGAEQ